MSESIWYSFFDRTGYKGTDPHYYDVRETSWGADIEANWLEIRNELDSLIAGGHEMMPYFAKDMVNKAQSWKTIPFFAWGVKFHKNTKKCPNTIKLLESIPGMVSASFNLLEPHSTIKPHYGDTNAIYRCHLGLYIPAGLPQCGFKVGDEDRPWQEGKLLLFCDAHYHTAWNNSDGYRYILLFDVVRDKYKDSKKNVCSTVLASLFLQSASEKIRFLKAMPYQLQYLTHAISKFFAGLLIGPYNYWNKLVK